jgi:hypothetical protein
MKAPDNQLAMFDLGKREDAPAYPREFTPGCLLPVQQAQTIDVGRAAKILAVVPRTVVDLIERDVIPHFRVHERQNWSIPYDGIVALCDRLRAEFMIRDRRPRLAPGARRWRDEDLLPFPVSDTLSAGEVAVGFDVRKEKILQLITDRAAGELGVFEAYRLSSVSPWRISRISVCKYAEELRRKLKV